MKLLKLWEKVKRVKTMIREVLLSDKEREFLINLLKEAKEESLDYNERKIEKNKHKSNYLYFLNENNKLKLMVEKLIEKLN